MVQFIQPILATMRNDQPGVAAFHPVLALVIFWLALTIGLRAWRLVREPASAPAGARPRKPPMDWQPWLVFAHVLGAFTFVLAHGVSIFVALRLRSERDLTASAPCSTCRSRP